MSFNIVPYEGSNPIFNEKETTYNFNQSVNKVNFRQIPPTQTYPIGISNLVPPNLRPFAFFQKYVFEFTTERFTALRDWCIYFNGDVATSTASVAFPLINLPSIVQMPYGIAQQICSFNFYIENQKIHESKETDHSILPSFLFTPMKHEKRTLDRIGKPFTKLIQERIYINNVAYSSYDSENDGIGILRVQTGTNNNPEKNQFKIPLYLFSNFFSTPNTYLPPGIKIKIEFEISKAEFATIYENYAPGNTYFAATIPTPVKHNYIVRNISNVGIYVKEFFTTDLFSQQFITRWKSNLWINRFFTIENTGFNPVPTDAIKKSFKRLRLSIQDPVNSFLMVYLANPYRPTTGYEQYTLGQTIETSGAFTSFAFSFVAPNQTSTLCLYPFKIDFLRVYLESSNQPIIDFTPSERIISDYILRSLNELTKNFCKRIENEEDINKSDIYGLRAAPFFIPLCFDKLNSNFGPLPIFGNYLIDIDISTIDTNLPIPAGYNLYIRTVKAVTIGISASKELSIIKSPNEIDKHQQKLIGATAEVLA